VLLVAIVFGIVILGAAINFRFVSEAPELISSASIFSATRRSRSFASRRR